MTYNYKQLLDILKLHKGEEHTIGEWVDILTETQISTQSVTTSLDEFVKQLEFDGTITNDELYNLYLECCEGVPLVRDSFLKRLPKTLRKHRPEIVPYRTGKFRGYRATVS